MQLTEDDVQDFVNDVIEYYSKKTILGDASYVDDYGSAKLPTEKLRVSANLQTKHFNRGSAVDTLRRDIDDIASFERSKVLSWFESEHDVRKQVDKSRFSRDLRNKCLKPLMSPIQILLPDKMEYRLRVDEDSYSIPIIWFHPDNFDQTGFVLDRGASVLQKQQGDNPVVDSSLGLGPLPAENSENGLTIQISENPNTDGVSVELLSEFSELRKSQEYNSVCMLDLPSMDLPT